VWLLKAWLLEAWLLEAEASSKLVASSSWDAVGVAQGLALDDVVEARLEI
jgi:hypothetical protein